MRYQLDIIGDSVGDLVLHAGGWIYDRVAAGWEVHVLLPPGTDLRPVAILGAEGAALDAADRGLRAMGRRPQAIAAPAELCRRDQWLASLVATELRRGNAEITLWGEQWPSNLESTRGPVSHRLSLAARAFKAQALAAAGESPLSVGKREVFRTAAVTHAWIGADLVPAG